MRFEIVLTTVVLLAGAAFARQPNVIIIYTDDHGYADLGIHGMATDVKTPQLDQMARDGALCKEGYITAPQCSPSRAGMITGRHQQRFGFGHNGEGPLPLDEVTLPDRMKEAGYRTGMIGKWHLEPNWTMSKWINDELGIAKASPKTSVPFDRLLEYYPQNRGFDEFFKGELNRYWINYDLEGNDRAPEGEWQDVPGYRLEIQTDAAISFIDRNQEKPFLLYLAYFAPHVPLDATQKYLDRFPGEMPERRRYALAMISAMDDGVGRIRDHLKALGLAEDTLILFAADNGAPLKMTMEDKPISYKGGAWDGSLNTPWVGEKGMITEGGIHVPYIVCWPGTIPAGTVCTEPVSSLDFVPTSLAAAGADIPEGLDGVDIVPFLSGKTEKLAERDLFWRFWGQTAIRRDNWKYLRLNDGREYLFDLSSEEHENENLISSHPEKAQELQIEMAKWAEGLKPAGLEDTPLQASEAAWYQFYVK